MEINKIICGDSLQVLRQMPDEFVDCVLTSPPYYALRNYQVEGQIGLEPTFEEYKEKLLEIIAEIKRVLKSCGSFWLNMSDIFSSHSIGEGNVGGIEGKRRNENEAYKKAIQAMGTRFDKKNYGGLGQKRQNTTIQGRGRGLSIPDKCLLMMPERIAMEMIDNQGWILRNKICWAKQVFLKKEGRTMGSVMPTSVKDRLNESWEFLYFFVKNKKYYSNLDAVRLPHQTFENRPDGFTRSRELHYDSKRLEDYSPQSKQSGQRFNYRVRDVKRKEGQPQFRASAEEIKKYKEETGKIRGGGANTNLPWNPITGGKIYAPADHRGPNDRTEKNYGLKNKVNDPRGNHLGGPGSWRDFKDEHESFTSPFGKNLPTVWLIQSEPHNFQKELGVQVDHFATFPQALLEIPIKFGCPPDGIVLDPFAGTGTTCLVAKKLGRRYIGIELNPD